MVAEFCDRCGKFIDADMRLEERQNEEKGTSQFMVAVYGPSGRRYLKFCPECESLLQTELHNFTTGIMPYSLHTTPAEVGRSDEVKGGWGHVSLL